MSLWSYVIIALLSLAPGLEVRASIPLGIAIGLDPISVYILSMTIGLIPSPIIIYGLNKLEHVLVHRRIIGSFFTRYISYVRVKAKNLTERRSVYIALALFVGIPLPGTGVWTGSFIAYVLGLSRFKAILSIIAGNVIASSLVLLGSLGVLEILKFLIT